MTHDKAAVGGSPVERIIPRERREVCRLGVVDVDQVTLGEPADTGARPVILYARLVGYWWGEATGPYPRWRQPGMTYPTSAAVCRGSA